MDSKRHLSIFLLSASLLIGQTGPLKPMGKFDRFSEPLALNQTGVIQVRVLGDPSASWIVGAHVDASSPARVEATEILYDGRPSRGPMLGFKGGRAPVRPQIQVDGNVITVTPSAGEGFSMAIAISTPAAARLSVEGPSQPTSLSYNDSIIVRNGAVIPEKFTNLAQLMSLVILDDVLTAAPLPSRSSEAADGKYDVTLSSLRPNLLRYEACSPLKAAQSSKMAMVTIDIDTTGKVSDVKGLSPDLGACAESIRRWAFSPVLKDGSAVAATATFPLIVWPGGRISVPLDQHCSQCPSR